MGENSVNNSLVWKIESYHYLKILFCSIFSSKNLLGCCECTRENVFKKEVYIQWILSINFFFWNLKLLSKKAEKLQWWIWWPLGLYRIPYNIKCITKTRHCCLAPSLNGHISKSVAQREKLKRIRCNFFFDFGSR